MSVEFTNLKELFIKHHNVCPGCKCSSEKTWTEEWGRRCSCGFRWIPKNLTEDNLKKFEEFLSQTDYIFT